MLPLQLLIRCGNQEKRMAEKKPTKEIDVLGILKKILQEWKLTCKFIVAFAIIGVIVALNTPKRYTTNVILAPELANSSLLSGGLSNIASMMGVNLGASQSGMDAIYPLIYPDVLTSSDFILQLFNVKVRQKKDSISKTYYNHLIQDSKIPFWSYPSIWLSELFKSKDEEGNGKKGIDPFRLSKQQDGVLNAIRGSISCIVDKNTNVISISVSDIDPNVSAMMADTIQKQLQKYIIAYRTKKARNDLAYAEVLCKEAKKEYIQSQQEFSAYADANTGLLLESYKSKLNNLENDMQLKFNVFNQVSQQLQLAKAKVQEQTPAFSVIQSASVPLQASSFPRSFMVILYMLFGIAVAALWILYIRDFVRKRKESK